jgi:hypothetical protein
MKGETRTQPILGRAVDAATTQLLAASCDPYSIDHDAAAEAARIVIVAALPVLCEDIAREIESKPMVGSAAHVGMAQRWAAGIARRYAHKAGDHR